MTHPFAAEAAADPIIARRFTLGALTGVGGVAVLLAMVGVFIWRASWRATPRQSRFVRG